jgi:class 3 adenylate cyclase
MVAGDIVNTASRLQSAAAPGARPILDRLVSSQLPASVPQAEKTAKSSDRDPVAQSLT